MCRLYGFRATEPTKVECTLVLAQNALLLQSKSDRRGRSHPDGWGISCYQNQNGSPQVERRAAPAYEDLHFSTIAERVHARAVIAHIRLATVGLVSEQNTHPFTLGRWTFAHNGTITAFNVLQQQLARDTGDDLQSHRRGSTDSEQAFLWIMSRARAAGLALEAPEVDLDTLAQVVAQSITELAARCQAAHAPKPPRLNFLLTNGQQFLASRWDHDLYYVERHGVHDCEICGIPHIHHQPDADYRALVVASEPISHESWREVPNRSLLLVSPDLSVRIQTIQPPGR